MFHPAIARVSVGVRQARGTAFRVSKQYAITALHVVAGVGEFWHRYLKAPEPFMLNGESERLELDFLEPVSLTFQSSADATSTAVTCTTAARLVEGCWSGSGDWALLRMDAPPPDDLFPPLAVCA